MVLLKLRKGQWPLYVNEVYRVLQPGTGWAQFTELQGHRFLSESFIPDDSPLREVFLLFRH